MVLGLLLKTDPNNKNYDPNYAYQVSAGKAALGEIDIDSAKAEQTQALTTAMSRLTEFDENWHNCLMVRKKRNYKKKRNDWF